MGRLLRFWLARLLLFVIAGAVVVLMVHIPGGSYYGPAQESVVNGRIQIAADAHWSWDVYWKEVREFGRQVGQRNMPYYSQPSARERHNFMPRFKDDAYGSLILFGYATLIGSVTGVLMGVLYALRAWAPRVLGFTMSTLGLLLPDFIAVILGQALTIWLWRTYDVKPWQALGDTNSLKGMVLPIFSLAFLPMGYLARVTGAALDDILWEDYIRTARAKGLPEWRVLFGHAFRNAVPRVVAGLPGLMILTLSGLVVVERLTAWGGLGQVLFADIWRMVEGPRAGEWSTISPQIVAMAGLIFLGGFLLFEGIAQSLRLLYANPSGEVEQ